jgi:hypothetical protein
MTDQTRSVRAITKLEVGLGLAGAVQFAGVIWFAATLNSTVKQLQIVVTELTRNVASIQATAPRTAVLEYRVEQLERRMMDK